MERNGRYVRLKIGHGLLQKAYLEWKFQKLKSLSTSSPRFVEGALHRKTEKRYSRVEFATLSLPLFEEYWQKFYIQGKKRIPLDISEYLSSPLA